MSIMQKLGKILLKCLLLAFGSLPLKVQYVNARFLAWLAGSVISYRRDDVMVNLARSFPDKKYGELKEIRKKFYRHFADIIVETAWFGACRNPERLRRQQICRIVNPEVIGELYEKCPSVIIMYSHCGNWELYGGIENYNPGGAPTHISEDNFTVVYKRMSSKVWDELLHENRIAPLKDRDAFKGYIESNDIVRFVFEHRGQKKFYNLNTDQSPYYNSGANIGIEFMHQQTFTMTAAAALARKFSMGIVYLNMRPETRGHYIIEFTTIAENASEMSVPDIMGRYYELLGKDIDAMPENYLWTHRRWKL